MIERGICPLCHNSIRVLDGRLTQHLRPVPFGALNVCRGSGRPPEAPIVPAVPPHTGTTQAGAVMRNKEEK